MVVEGLKNKPVGDIMCFRSLWVSSILQNWNGSNTFQNGLKAEAEQSCSGDIAHMLHTAECIFPFLAAFGEYSCKFVSGLMPLTLPYLAVTNLAAEAESGGGLQVCCFYSNQGWNCSAGQRLLAVTVCSAWRVFFFFFSFLVELLLAEIHLC